MKNSFSERSVGIFAFTSQYSAGIGGLPAGLAAALYRGSEGPRATGNTFILPNLGVCQLADSAYHLGGPAHIGQADSCRQDSPSRVVEDMLCKRQSARKPYATEMDGSPAERGRY